MPRQWCGQRKTTGCPTRAAAERFVTFESGMERTGLWKGGVAFLTEYAPPPFPRKRAVVYAPRTRHYASLGSACQS